MAKDDKKKIDTGKLKDLLIAGGAPGAAAWLGGKGLGHIATRPSRGSADQQLNLKLLEHARDRNIIVRKGAENAAEAFIYPKNVNDAIRRAAKRGIRLNMDTPEGPVPLQALMGKQVVWLDRGLDTSPAVFAHEIGHLSSKPRHPDWNHVTFTIPNVIAPAAGIGTAALGSRLAKTPEGARMAGKAGALVSLIGSLPMLLSEGRASVRGIKALRQSGATRGQAARLGFSRLLPAFGTYTLMAGAPALTSYLIGRAVAKHKSKKEEK
jgi:hypothetical protein